VTTAVVQSKGQETRCRILNHALALASASGIEGLTLGVLASSLELSKSGLFAHFRSREALQIAVLEVAAERFKETVVAPALRAPRGEAQVRALFQRWLDWGKAKFQPGGCVFVSAAAELDDRPGPVRDVLVQGQRDWMSLLAKCARDAVDGEQFRKDVDPEQFAFELYALVLGFHHHSRLLREPQAVKRVRVAFDRLMDSALAPSA
jgi:AcrR family transcriptional regulator